MVLLHGGVLCPAELGALAASMPWVVAVGTWLWCRLATAWARLR